MNFACKKCNFSDIVNSLIIYQLSDIIAIEILGKLSHSIFSENILLFDKILDKYRNMFIN